MSPNMQGALLMVASMVSFTTNDMFIKLTAGALPLAQLLAVRGAIALVLILALSRAFGPIRFDFGRRGWFLISIRSVTEIGAAFCFLNALLNMPLPNVSAILQVLPLTVSLGAYVFLKEPLGWRRMTAILIGFVGMLLIVRPGPEGFSVWSLYSVGAVVSVTARDLVTRLMPPDLPSLGVATMNTITVALFFFLLSLTEPWVPVTADLWWLIIGSAVTIVGGYYFSVRVMRVGEIGFIAPFRYSSLITALILGWFVFGDWPDGLTLLGAAIVVGAGLFTLWRERQMRTA